MYTMLIYTNDIRVSKNFMSREFMCKCNYDDCNHAFIYHKTSDSLQRFRDSLGYAIFLTSAYRCQRHNTDVDGHVDSYHKKGHAVDIVVPKSVDITEFADNARNFFDVVIEYPDRNFIHGHNF